MGMKKLSNLLLMCMLCTAMTAQVQVTADVVSYGNTENTEFILKEMVTNAISRIDDGCMSFNVIDDYAQASQPYIFEIWDNEEFISQYIFKETRTKTKTAANGSKSSTKYTVAGVKVRAIYNVAGRLVERETGNVVDVFQLGDIIDREIPVDEVAKKYRIGSDDNAVLSDKILAEYAIKIESERDSTIRNFENAISEALIAPLSLFVLPPPTVAGIVEQKKEKVKSVGIDYCTVESLYRYGSFYHPILEEKEMFGEKIYPEVATYYGEPKHEKFGIRKGEEELLPLIKGGAKLLATRPNRVISHRLAAHKSPKPHKVAFVMEYPLISNYTAFERKHIELLLQASLLGYKNVMVIANDPIIEKINVSFGKTGERAESITTEDAMSGQSNKTIWVNIGNPNKTLEARSILGQKVQQSSPDTRYTLIDMKMKIDSKEYVQTQQIEGNMRKNGIAIANLYLDMVELVDPLIDLSVQILGINEEKKDKVKSVYIKGSEMLNDGAKYKVYNKKTVTKKTKAVAELKIDEIVGSTIAIAEVKKGDKELKALMKNTLYIYPDSGGGLSSFLSADSKPESGSIRNISVSRTSL